MICRGPVSAGRGADVRKCGVEELSRLEHELQEAGQNLKQAVEANTTYEKKLCAQAAEPEPHRNRLAEPEKADAEKAAEVVRLRKAPEAADHRTMDDTMVRSTGASSWPSAKPRCSMAVLLLPVNLTGTWRSWTAAWFLWRPPGR
ncbi:hypothetical protein ACSQ67_024894 [Phaseolus vulgaris]